MESPTHTLPALFKQLGLADDPVSIERFIASHSPLKPELHLADAFSGARARRISCAMKSSTMPTGPRWWTNWMCC